MSDLAWQLRDHLSEFRQDGRLFVLMSIYLHKNTRNRSWPSNETIMQETGLTSRPVSQAIKWLVDNRAVIKVPYSKRVGKETELPKHKNIFQLTGVVTIKGELIPYLYLNPESWEGIVFELEQLGESVLSKYLQSKCLPSTPEGITDSLEGDTDINTPAEESLDEKPPEPQSDDCKGVKENRQDVVFNAIAVNIFKINPIGIKDKRVSGRLAGVAKTARDTFEGAYPTFFRQGWTPELEGKCAHAVELFAEWHKTAHPNTALSKAREKFGTDFLVYLQMKNGQSLKRANAEQKPTQPTETPEQAARRKAELAEAMKRDQPAWRQATL